MVIQTKLYVTQNIWHDIVAIRKNIAILTPTKPVYIKTGILELSKVLMYRFHYHYIRYIYGNNSRYIFTGADSLMYEIKTEDINEDFSSNRKIFDFSSYSTKSKYYDHSNKLVFDKIKDETAGVAREGFVGLQPKICSYLVDDSSKHKKAKGVNKNTVATISHNKFKNFSLNKKCMRHSMKRIQSKHHKIGTYEINKIFLSCFNDKIYIKNIGCDLLALGYQS